MTLATSDCPTFFPSMLAKVSKRRRTDQSGRTSLIFTTRRCPLTSSGLKGPRAQTLVSDTALNPRAPCWQAASAHPAASASLRSCLSLSCSTAAEARMSFAPSLAVLLPSGKLNGSDTRDCLHDVSYKQPCPARVCFFKHSTALCS